jgi:hypothetical protein
MGAGAVNIHECRSDNLDSLAAVTDTGTGAEGNLHERVFTEYTAGLTTI